MANSILTDSIITRAAVRLFINSNNFLQNINRQYDDQFAVDGAKIGTQLRIRLPNDYVVTSGPAASIQDTTETQTTLTVATQKHVDMSFNTSERTLSIEDYSERVLEPAINKLAGAVALDVMSGSEGGVCNYTSNVDSGNNVIAPTANTFLYGKAQLDANSARPDKRMLAIDPFADAAAAGVLTGLLNPATEISQQYRSGAMKNGLGWSWMMDQTVLKHTTGSFSAGTVNGASQTGLTITVNAITGTLNKGDIITFASVNGVNRVTAQTTGKLQQFVVTSNVASGATSIPIYPALIPAVNGNMVQYQTVTVSPANGATILLVSKASETYVKNIGFVPEAITMATADLMMPKGVHDSGRTVYDGISMRMITDYVFGTDQLASRIDVLYGYTYVRPEWAVVIASPVV